MGETLKERLDRLVAETQRNQFPDEMLKAFDTLCSSLASAYRSGDLIPRDEITPQMAAEVLLMGQGHAQAISRSLRQEGYLVPIAQVYAALTAIKESKDADQG